MKHVYLGPKKTLNPSCHITKLSTLEPNKDTLLKTEEITEYPEIMQERVDEIEKELREKITSRWKW
jgi:hypothetical protein